MAKVGAQRAAELTGKSKSTIQRAMKSGKLSYDVDANDRRVIDVSELERAFGLVPQESDKQDQQAVEAEIEKATRMLEMERLKMRIKLLEEQLEVAREAVEDLKEQRDQWQKQAQQTLITSQFSQKQAEELKEEIKNRDERARMRRQQMMQQQQKGKAAQTPREGMKRVSPHNENARPEDAQSEGRVFDIHNLWQKFRTQDEEKKQA